MAELRPGLSTLAPLWRRARREASWLRDQLRPAPREVLLETTRACNLRCFHCAVGEPGYQAGTLSWEAFVRTLPFLRRHRPLVHLNGHGETLLHARFVDMFRAVVDCGCRVGFQTNGMLLTPELARRLLDIAPPGRFAYVRFSVDAADKRLFDRIRTNGDFDVVRANMLSLEEEKRRRGAAAPVVQLETCAMLLNVHQLSDLVRLTHEVGGAELCVSDIIEYARASGQRLARSPELAVPYWLEAERTARELGVTLSMMPELRALLDRAASGMTAAPPDPGSQEVAADAEARCILPPQTGREPAAPPERDGARAPTIRECRDPWRLAFVDAGGGVKPCCIVSLPMGNIGEQPLDRIWRGERYRVFRRLLASRSPLPQCSTCIMRAWAPMPLVLRARAAAARAARQLVTIRRGAETRYGLHASPAAVHRDSTVHVDLSVTPGRSGGGPVDLFVEAVEPGGGRAFLDGRGLSSRPTPLIVDWEPFTVRRFTIATFRVPAAWAGERVTLSLTAAPSHASPPDLGERLGRAEASLAVATR